MTLINAAEILTLNELQLNAAASIVGKSVRVIGSLIEFDLATEQGVIEMNRIRFPIATNRLSYFVARLGTMYQFIGELKLNNKQTNQVLLDCRIARCVNGIDMFLYEKALAVQRECVRNDALGVAAVNEEIGIIEKWFNDDDDDDK